MAVFVLCVGYEYGCGVVVSLTTNGPSLLFLDFYVMRRHIEATTRAPDPKFFPSRNIAMSLALAALPPNYYAATAVHERIENWEMIHSIPIVARCEFCGVCLCGGRLTR